MMSKANCPNCGALIGTGMPGLPVVVCDFCHSLLSKAGDHLSKVGEAGQVPFDVSPLQIGTTLTVDGKSGEIVGRERWAYEGGFWNEWLLQLAGGETRWVAEESGLFMIMEQFEGEPEIIASLQAIEMNDPRAMGTRISIDNTAFTIADMKIVRCVGVEGSLPHEVGADQARASIDLRTADKRAVTWQKDAEGHSLWRGAYYRLADLAPGNLRRFEHWPRPEFETSR